MRTFVASMAALIAVALVATLSLRAQESTKAQESVKPQTSGSATPEQHERPPRAENGGEPALTVLDHHEVHGVLGKDVQSAAEEKMGRVVDVVVDQNGQVRAAVIDFGGFLGLGSRKIAVAWNALRFPGDKQPDHITLELTRDQVRATPEYKEDKPVVVLGLLGSLQTLPSL